MGVALLGAAAVLFGGGGGSAAVPGLRPVIPDPGNPIQLVHHDDVATAIAAAATVEGHTGAYNLAGDGVISFTDIAAALGAVAIPVPRAAAVAASEVLARRVARRVAGR